MSEWQAGGRWMLQILVALPALSGVPMTANALAEDTAAADVCPFARGLGRGSRQRSSRID